MQLSFYEDGYLAGIGASYTLDYSLRNEVTFNGTHTDNEIKIELLGRKIWKISGFVNEIGISQLVFSYDQGEDEVYGVASSDSVEREILASERYYVIGFFGEICDGYIRFFYIYVRTNPDEPGCECGLDLLGNGECNYPTCYTAECGYDGDDCDFPGCPEECTLSMLFNDECDL